MIFLLKPKMMPLARDGWKIIFDRKFKVKQNKIYLSIVKQFAFLLNLDEAIEIFTFLIFFIRTVSL